MYFLLKRAQEIAAVLKKADEVHIVTHIDADGITAGAIAQATIQRLGKTSSIECVKQLDELVLKRLKKEGHELVWFTDLGSSIVDEIPKMTLVVTDHHMCSKESHLRYHLNPHLFGVDGSFEISGAGVTYLVSKTIDPINVDLSALAVIGACGDLQDRRHCKLVGMNKGFLEDGKTAHVLECRKDIRYFGRETRPLPRLLQYANDPFLPGLSGREEACVSFLEDLKIRLNHKESARRWIDLSNDERKTILSALARLLLMKGFGAALVERMIGDVYLLAREEPGSELHDAKEYATLLNSTARYGKHEVGLAVCLGDRGKSLEDARILLQGHRQNLVESLQFARDETLQKRTNVQFFHAGEGIRDTIIGIVTNMMLQDENVDKNMPLLGFVHTENGDVKVSARTTQQLIERGVDLSAALRHAAAAVQGVGGGHDIAAGATIPKGKEEEFLVFVEQKIRAQLSL